MTQTWNLPLRWLVFSIIIFVLQPGVFLTIPPTMGLTQPVPGTGTGPANPLRTEKACKGALGGILSLGIGRKDCYYNIFAAIVHSLLAGFIIASLSMYYEDQDNKAKAASAAAAISAVRSVQRPTLY